MEYTLQFVAILGTLSLLWLTLQAIRRFRPQTAKGVRLEVRERVSLANGSQLVAVIWDGQELLVAIGSQPCTLIASKPADGARTPKEASAAWAHS